MQAARVADGLVAAPGEAGCWNVHGEKGVHVYGADSAEVGLFA